MMMIHCYNMVILLLTHS